MVNKNIVQLERFRAEKKKESLKMNDLKKLQIGYFAPDSNDLVAIIVHLTRFQEITKRVVGEEIYEVIENELEKED
mgnify:CR=1 FL=1